MPFPDKITAHTLAPRHFSVYLLAQTRRRTITPDLQHLTNALLEAAHKAGAEAADAMTIAGTSLSIGVRNGTLEQAERAEGVDIGLRVLLGQRQANVSASDTRPETLTTLAERAVAMAREAPEDPHIGLAEPDQLAREWNISTLELNDPRSEPSPKDLQQNAEAAEAAALSVKHISQVQSATAGYSHNAVHLAASNGFSGSYSRTGYSLSCVAIAGTGSKMERDYDGDGRIFKSDMRTANDIGTSAATRAVDRLGARKPPTGTYPVLFDERISSSLIGHLLMAVNGGAIARGSSWLRNNLGMQVLPDTLSIIEDPHLRRVSGSRPFDAEGLPTLARRIVDHGTLTGWTLDLATGRKLGMASTGNAKRGLSSPPSPSTWNIALTQGNQTRENLLADMGTGLLVTSLIGSTINPNTGDYSRGASGFWVENGALQYPVNECTIAGSLPQMLRRMIPANDARTHLSTVVPSLLIEEMTLAGS